MAPKYGIHGLWPILKVDPWNGDGVLVILLEQLLSFQWLDCHESNTWEGGCAIYSIQLMIDVVAH